MESMLFILTVYLDHMVDNLIVGLGYSLLVFTQGWKWPGLLLLAGYGFLLWMGAYTHAALVCALATVALVHVTGLVIRRARKKAHR